MPRIKLIDKLTNHEEKKKLIKAGYRILDIPIKGILTHFSKDIEGYVVAKRRDNLIFKRLDGVAGVYGNGL